MGSGSGYSDCSVFQAEIVDLEAELACLKEGKVWSSSLKTCEAQVTPCVHTGKDASNHSVVLFKGKRSHRKKNAAACYTACKSVAADFFSYVKNSHCKCRTKDTGFVLKARNNAVTGDIHTGEYVDTECSS